MNFLITDLWTDDEEKKVQECSQSQLANILSNHPRHQGLVTEVMERVQFLKVGEYFIDKWRGLIITAILASIDVDKLRPFKLRNFQGGRCTWNCSLWKDGKRIAKMQYISPGRYAVHACSDGLNIYESDFTFTPEQREIIINAGNNWNSCGPFAPSHCEVGQIVNSSIV